MDDLISRQAAIDVVGANTWAGSRIRRLPTADFNDYTERLWKEAYERGKRDAQPKKGKWIMRGHMCECTACEHSRPISVYPMFFCPNCGARMEENDG